MTIQEQQALKKEIRRLKRIRNKLRLRRRNLKRKITALGLKLDKMKSEERSPYSGE